jgi:hypothetical protein
LGYEFWQREFGGEAEVLGRTIELSGQSLVIVGVARRGAGRARRVQQTAERFGRGSGRAVDVRGRNAGERSVDGDRQRCSARRGGAQACGRS